MSETTVIAYDVVWTVAYFSIFVLLFCFIWVVALQCDWWDYRPRETRIIRHVIVEEV